MHELATLAIRDRAIPLWRLRREPAGYLGWANRGNLGDDAMFKAFALTVRRCRPHLLPLHRPGRSFLRVDSAKTIVLGGGTLIFRDEWVTRVEAVQRAMPDADLIVAGTACEDPEYARLTGVGSDAGERAWIRILEKAGPVGVRGPISQRILADRGIRAQVIGDPALALTGPGIRPKVTDILLNLAAVEDGYTDRHYGVIQAAVRHWRNDGLTVSLFGTERSDLDKARDLLGDTDCEIGPFSRSVSGLCEQIASARIVVSERLHGSVLACAMGIPFVSLAYKPKIFDFLESVDADTLALATRSLDLDSLLERVSTSSSVSWIARRDHLAATYRKFVDESLGVA